MVKVSLNSGTLLEKTDGKNAQSCLQLRFTTIQLRFDFVLLEEPLDRTQPCLGSQTQIKFLKGAATRQEINVRNDSLRHI
jgi:hypothetical protein